MKKITGEEFLDGCINGFLALGATVQTLLTTTNVDRLADVSEAAWVSAGIGAVLVAAKTIQSRRVNPEP